MAVATACANIALVKYWGKRDGRLNLPAAGSLSATLDALRTWTEVTLAEASEDELVLDGRPRTGRERERVSAFLDLVRALAPPELRGVRAKVVSRSTFPAAAGLASSASGFAALAVAAAAAYRVELSPAALSGLARRGSGSAARSVFGGYVRMAAGVEPDGSDAVAHPLAGVDFPLAAAILLLGAGEKSVGSTDGMELTRRTSPYHEAWLALVERDLATAEQALRARDFGALAEVVEGSCLAMHADALAARPGILYWKPDTLRAIERVRALRAGGLPVTFTIDAGPHLVAFTPPEHLAEVAGQLGALAPGARVLSSSLGPAASVLPGWPEASKPQARSPAEPGGDGRPDSLRPGTVGPEAP